MIVQRIKKSILFCCIVTVDKKENIVTIPHIILNAWENNELPFILYYKQFPVRLAFALIRDRNKNLIGLVYILPKRNLSLVTANYVSLFPELDNIND